MVTLVRTVVAEVEERLEYSGELPERWDDMPDYEKAHWVMNGESDYSVSIDNILEDGDWDIS